MPGALEKNIFEKYSAEKKLKHSRRRLDILDVFLSVNGHLTAEELYVIVRKKFPRVGSATVYRTLKLFCECGLCRELKFEDGVSRYEHLYGQEHHDHLICTKCGKLVEIVDEDIERLQDKLFKAYGFAPQRHRMELYGVCKKCKG